MPISQQILHSMHVTKLKNIIDLDISFEGSKVTAILGPNGNGKSTILHILACLFSPNESGENFKFSSFFRPNTDSLWNDSELAIRFSYRDGKEEYLGIIREYRKITDRWSPRYVNRPLRDTYYIGIDKCVPMIELEKKQSKINYSTLGITDATFNEVLTKASHILGRNYSTYNIHTAAGRNFMGVEVDGLRYSALSMSAGEQKVFYLLEKVFNAPKYSLILIEELDMLLHDLAMKKLVEVILDRATAKHLQVIFTTHRESILALEDKINVRHIISRPGKTLCFNETKPDAINRLTGKQPKPLEVFVEDDLSYTIVQKIASQLKIIRFVDVVKYGAAINCFTTVAGLLLSGERCENSLFVIDGDVYRDEQEKASGINHVLTGHDLNVVKARQTAIGIIKQYNLPAKVSPEKYLHSLLVAMEPSDNSEQNEIIEVAKEIIAPANDHFYLSNIITRLGWDRNIGLSKIIDLVALSASWPDYVSEVYSWLEARVNLVSET